MLSPQEFGRRLLELDPAAISHPRDVDALLAQVAESDHQELIPFIFAFFEAHPSNDAGAPGTLVHLVEHYDPEYRPFLLESVSRTPSFFSTLMINRLLNSDLTDTERNEYVQVLKDVLANSVTPERVRRVSAEFLVWQKDSDPGKR
jgi:hypothetical protein